MPPPRLIRISDTMIKIQFDSIYLCTGHASLPGAGSRIASARLLRASSNALECGAAELHAVHLDAHTQQQQYTNKPSCNNKITARTTCSTQNPPAAARAQLGTASHKIGILFCFVIVLLGNVLFGGEDLSSDTGGVVAASHLSRSAHAGVARLIRDWQ